MHATVEWTVGVKTSDSDNYSVNHQLTIIRQFSLITANSHWKCTVTLLSSTTGHSLSKANDRLLLLQQMQGWWQKLCEDFLQRFFKCNPRMWHCGLLKLFQQCNPHRNTLIKQLMPLHEVEKFCVNWFPFIVRLILFTTLNLFGCLSVRKIEWRPCTTN